MTALYLNSTKNIHSRDAVYLNGLCKLGVKIVECRDWSPGLRKFFALYHKHKKLKGKYDIIFVGYSGHLLVPFARLISRKPVIFNALASLYEGMVVSRNRRGPLDLYAPWYWLVDFIGFRCANLVLIETNAQKKYLQKIFHLPGKKFLRAWSGVDENKFFFDSSIPKLSRFTVLFRGAFLPESGIQYAVEAAKILQNTNVRFRIIGDGMMAPQVEKIIASFDSKKVEWIRERLSDEELRIKTQECHLSLGQLSNHERLTRTIPFKAFESMAMKLPYLTARNKGILELLKENETCLACNPADPEDLAKKILWTKDHPQEIKEIAEKSYQLFKNHTNSDALALDLISEMKKLEIVQNAGPKKMVYLTSIYYPAKTVASPVQISKMAKEFSKMLGDRFTLVLSRAKNLKNINIIETKCETYKKLHLTTLFYFFWLINFLRDKKSEEYIFYSRDQKLTTLLIFIRKFARLKYKIAFEYHIIYKNYLDRFISKNSDFLIPITLGLKEFIVSKLDAAPDRIIVAPDGVDMEEFDIPGDKQKHRENLGLPLDKEIIGYTGTVSTLGMEKGVKTIISAANLLKNRNDVLFYIVGIRKRELKKYSHIVKRAGLDKKVKLLEYQPREKIPAYLKSFDLFLMPFPRTKHFAYFMSPLKMFEAMASGVPMIASDLPAVREILSEKEAKFMEPGNSEALADSITDALNSPEKYKSLAQKAYNKVKDYTWEIRTEKILNFIMP